MNATCNVTAMNSSEQGRFSGVVIMPNKPINCGLKFIVLTEADTGYILNSIMHDKDMGNLEYAQNYKAIAWIFELLQSSNLEGRMSYLQQNYEVCAITITFYMVAFYMSLAICMLFAYIFLFYNKFAMSAQIKTSISIAV